MLYKSQEAAESVAHLYGGEMLVVGAPSDADAPAKPAKAKSTTKKVAAPASASVETDPAATLES